MGSPAASPSTLERFHNCGTPNPPLSGGIFSQENATLLDAGKGM
jgi:hypothetical protein